MLLYQFPLAFLHTQKELILELIGLVFVIILEILYETISLKLVLLQLLLNFVIRGKVAIDVYIPHRKYQVKPHLSPWSSAGFMLLP